MSIRSFMLAAAMLVTPTFTLTATAQADLTHVYGPDPGWAKFRQIAEEAVIAQLIDPESARITWVSGYRKGGYKQMFRGRVLGYVACGLVNARNRMGGYAGSTAFVAVVDFDRALLVEMDSRPGGLRSEDCRKQIAEGRFPPVPRSTERVADSEPRDSDFGQPVNASPPAVSVSGLQVRAMPEGAYVSSVAPGSPAAAAGITPGMVVTSVNGIPLAGMGDAISKVVAAAGAGATLGIIGGKSVTLGGAR